MHALAFLGHAVHTTQKSSKPKKSSCKKIIIFSLSFASIPSLFHICQLVCIYAFIISSALEQLVQIMQLFPYHVLTLVPRFSP